MSSDFDLATLVARLHAGDDLAELFNARRQGFEQTLGLVFTRVGLDEIGATVAVVPTLHQPYGIVHGGVYASIAETLASVGAAVNALARGQTTVGLENSTSFLRAVRGGTLHGRALPQHRGQRTQMWTVEISDDEGRLAASARVRMLNLEGGATIAGETVAIRERP